MKELIFANKKGVGRMRRFFLTVLIFAVVFVFCGCGGGGYPEIKIDAAKMANAIINGVDFESNMQQINKDSISAFIDLPGADPAYMFMGAGEKPTVSESLSLILKVIPRMERRRSRNI